MKKTVWPSMKDIVSDYDKVEQELRDLRLVMACIAWQQDDKTLSVPIQALEAMPKNVVLAVSFDRTHMNYVFKAETPVEGTALAV